LLDAYLPGMDGWDVLSLLKADSETEPIPVIMVTASSDVQRSYDLGAAVVLKKPVTPAEVLSNIQAVLMPTPK